jgi:hypothetical protein
MNRLLYLLVVLAPGFAHAADGAPAVPVNSRIVTPASSVAPPCVAALLENDVIVSIPQQTLEALVASRRRPWANEPERLALIAGDRAQMLLSAVTAAQTPEGCQLLDPARAGIRYAGNSPGYLLADLVESGTAVVSIAGNRDFIPGVEVREVDRDCESGPIGTKGLVASGQQTPFLLLQTCRRG